MKLLGDEAQVEALFGLFGDSANLDEVHGLRRTYHSVSVVGHVESHFSLFGGIRWNF
jgi:hypothetical protein